MKIILSWDKMAGFPVKTLKRNIKRLQISGEQIVNVAQTEDMFVLLVDDSWFTAREANEGLEKILKGD